MEKLMNILLTNDDGIEAPGLWAAAQVLAQTGKVLIVAPRGDYSGYGAALPPARMLEFCPYWPVEGDTDSIRAFWIDGSPATCVQVGLSGALSPMTIDLVVSGINAGLNVGRDVVYSGTVGAAITAHILGRPAVAVSLDTGAGTTPHWSTAARYLGEILQDLAVSTASSQSTPPLLNVNVPNRPVSALSGVQFTDLSTWSCLDAYQVQVAQGNRLILEREYVGNSQQAVEGSDSWAIDQGCVSVTPLHLFGNTLVVSPGHLTLGRATSILEAIHQNGSGRSSTVDQMPAVVSDLPDPGQPG
jgi:5'-nucleotidase